MTANLKVIPLRPQNASQVEVVESPSAVFTPFQILFEGPKDSSPDTLRRLKGSLLSDLKLSIDEARQILECAPAPIKSAATSEELKPYLELLQRSGAKATIVANGKRIESPTQDKPLTVTEVFEIDTEMLLKEDEEPEELKTYFIEDESETENSNPEIENEVERLISELQSSAETPPNLKSEMPKTESVELKEPATNIQLQLSSSVKQPELALQSDLAVTPQFEIEESKTERRGSLYFMELEKSQIITEPDAPKMPPTPEQKAPQEVPPLAQTAQSEEEKAIATSQYIAPARHYQNSYQSFGFPRETLLSLLLSLLVLFVGNWLYFGSNKGVADLNLLHALLSMPNYSEDSDLTSNPPNLDPATISSHNEVADNFIDSKFELIGPKVQSYSVLFTTPPPPELSAIEMVYHKDRAAWLRKVEVSTNEISYLEDGIFVSSTVGKAYIEHKNTRIRVPAEVSIRGVYNEQTRSIEAKLKIKIGPVDSAANLPLTYLSAGLYRYAATAEFKTEQSTLKPAE